MIRFGVLLVIVVGLGAIADRLGMVRTGLRQQLTDAPEPLQGLLWQSGILGQAIGCKFDMIRLIDIMHLHSAVLDRAPQRTLNLTRLRQKLIVVAHRRQALGRGQPCPAVFTAVEAVEASLKAGVGS